jgi:hypothetical protein
MLLTPRRRATRELGRAHARDRLATAEKRDVEVAGGDRAGGVVDEQLRTVAADGGALHRLAGLGAEILGDERGGVPIMPADHRHTANRVGST